MPNTPQDDTPQTPLSDTVLERPETDAVARGQEEMRQFVRAGMAQVMPLVALSKRYKHLTMADMEWLVIAPLLQNQIAIAHHRDKTGEVGAAGMVIWAKVTEDTETKIKEQITSGVFPIRLKADEWRGGDRVWVLDVIAETVEVATHLFVELGKAQAPDGKIKAHPIISKLVNPDVLKQLRAKP